MIPKIEYNPALPIQENMTAICNWLNFALREITAGRVPEIRDDAARQIKTARADFEDVLCEQDADYSARLSEIEDAICELDKER